MKGAFPRLGRGQPLGNGGNGQIVPHPKAKPVGHGRDLFDPDPPRDVIKIDIAGIFQPLFHVHIAMAAAPPAMEAPIAQLHEAGAIDVLGHIDLARLQRGERHDNLERRSGRIGAGNRLVVKRAIFVGIQGLVFLCADTEHKTVGIKTGRGGHCDDIAGARIQNRCRRTFAGHAPLGIALQVHIDGQLYVGAFDPVDAAEFAHHPAKRVDLDPAGAGSAAQIPLNGLFNPGFADLKLGDL